MEAPAPLQKTSHSWQYGGGHWNVTVTFWGERWLRKQMSVCTGFLSTCRESTEWFTGRGSRRSVSIAPLENALKIAHLDGHRLAVGRRKRQNPGPLVIPKAAHVVVKECGLGDWGFRRGCAGSRGLVKTQIAKGFDWVTGHAGGWFEFEDEIQNRQIQRLKGDEVYRRDTPGIAYGRNRRLV